MSDRAAQNSRSVVVGTAGHIDHGKTSLVYALTGIDTDRLAEEKRRGISIDIGFAHLSLPDGKEVSFIDVPGHERFIKNMLAGAAGIEAVLLVVAADESVKPQTREHFEICRLLGLRRGIVVLTKCDAASEEQIGAAEADVRRLCAGSFLADAPLVRTSAATGAGLDDLKRELARFLSQPTTGASRMGIARLPLDRSFALKGFGTVVTGTLWSGTLRVGDLVEILPAKLQARIRGLQVHGKAVDAAVAGQRTAANLAGADHTEMQRGFVLTRPGTVEPARVIDAEVEWLEHGHIPASREQFLLHVGTTEVPVSLKILEIPENGQTFARIWLREPAVALPGDRFVLRRPSPAQTLAGGIVVDAHPPNRLSRAKLAGRTAALARADVAERIELLVSEARAGRGISELSRVTGLSNEQVTQAIKGNRRLHFMPGPERVVTNAWLAERRQKLVTFLKAFHAKFPSAAGAPITAARLGLDAAVAADVFSGFEAIRVQGDTVALIQHQPRFSIGETEVLDRIEQMFRKAGFQPPPVTEALKSAGTSDIKKSRDLLETLVKNQRLIRVANDLIFHADVITHIRKSLSNHKGRRFSVPEFKEWTQVSRKYAIPLLEYLDHQRVTRRDGDSRIVL